MSTENKITICCPECLEESFEIEITNSGQDSTADGINHWFEGNGVCSECGEVI